jgi:hypothetical protein
MSLSHNMTLTHFSINVLYLFTYAITVFVTSHGIKTSLFYLWKFIHIYLYSWKLSHICSDHLIYRIRSQIVELLSLFYTILFSFLVLFFSSLPFHLPGCQLTNLCTSRQILDSCFPILLFSLQFQPSATHIVRSRASSFTCILSFP